MKKNYIYQKFIFILTLLFSLHLISEEANTDVVRKGYADLTDINFSDKTDIELKGKWEFYWKKLLTPNDFASAKNSENQLYVDYPLRWSGQKVGNVILSANGFATYRAKVKLPTSREKYALYIQEIPTAYKVFVNGVEYKSNGIVGNSRKTSKADGRSSYISFKSNAGMNEIIVQTSNYVHREGGTWSAIRVGLDNKFRRTINSWHYIELFVIGSIMIMVVYHLMLFAFRPKELSPLFFALYCLLLGLRALTIGDSEFIYTLVPSISYKALTAIEYICFYFSVPFVFAFTSSLYPKDLKRIFVYLTLPFAIIFSLIALSTKVSFFTDTVEYYQIFTLVAIAILIGSLIRAIFKRREDIGIFIFGMILFVGLAAVDILREATKLFEFPNLTHLGLLGFVFMQSILLSKRFSRAYIRVEQDEKKIRAMHKDLLESEKARTLFFHNTSHELRTPLNGIIGYVELFVSNSYGDLNQKMKVQFRKMCNLAKSLKNQVNTILDLAKLKKGEMSLSASRIDLDEIYLEIRNLAEALIINKKGVSLDSRKKYDSSQKYFINDKEKVKTVIRNVLSNALKFRANDRNNKVSFTLERANDNLVITIIDTGIGVPDKSLNKIFVEFEQVQKSTRRSYEGTGLGLAMVKRIVDLMGGKIDLESKLGVGTKFIITLPEQKDVKIVEFENTTIKYEEFHEIEDIDETAIDSNVKDSEMFMKEGSYDILVVDDNLTNLEVIDQQLTSYGYKTKLADGGRAAIEYLESTMPDLVLLDLMMPEVSGEDVLKHMKNHPNLSEIPVIILTARASQQDLVLGLSLGADDYLAKPVNHEELFLRMQNLLSRVEAAKISEIMSQQEKMANIGEIFSDLSHEIKNLSKLEEKQMEIEREKINKMLRKIKLAEPAWGNFKRALFEDELPKLIVDRRDKLIKSDTNERLKRNVSNIMDVIKRTNISNLDMLKLFDSVKELSEEDTIKLDNLLNVTSFITQMDENTKKSCHIVSSVISYTNNENNNNQANLKSVVSNCLSLMSRKIGSNNVSVESDITENVIVNAKNSEVHQIILNVISNSIEALEGKDDNSRKIVIKTKEDESKGFKNIIIENTGPEITTEDREKIFNRGFTTKSSNRRGLGLYICKKLIERNNGTIAVYSNNNSTKFELGFRVD